MKLSVMERIALLSLLPKEGNLITLKIIRDLQNSISFNEKEIKEIKLRVEDNRYVWDKNIDSEIEIGEKATEVILDVFKKLDEENKINMQILELYERFSK